MIPLAQVFVQEFTSPLWVTVLAPFLLSERLSRHRVIAALAGFAGILIIARPDLSHLNPGILCALLWAGHMTLPDAATAPWLLLIGISGLVAHF